MNKSNFQKNHSEFRLSGLPNDEIFVISKVFLFERISLQKRSSAELPYTLSLDAMVVHRQDSVDLSILLMDFSYSPVGH